MERVDGRQSRASRAARQQEAVTEAVKAVDTRRAHMSNLRDRLEETLRRGTLMRHGREVGLNPEQRQRRVTEKQRLDAKLSRR